MVVELNVSISDQIAESARSYANSRFVTLDRAIEDLLRQSLGEPEIRIVDGFAGFVLPPETPVLTNAQLLSVEDEF
jgi:hypothetical protein